MSQPTFTDPPHPSCSFFHLQTLVPPLPHTHRLDNDGIDLLMSFLKVSLAISARNERDAKSMWHISQLCQDCVFGKKCTKACQQIRMQSHAAEPVLLLFFNGWNFFFCCPKFQYESKKRISADEAMRQPYFRSLGPRVHTLPESE